MSTLYIVATPIGNLKDLSHRAQETLKQVDWIAAEDTRTSKVLLDQYGIESKLIAYHAHNEAAASEGLIQKLQAGQSIALISDAGTPTIQDPGYHLVHKARLAGIPVIPIPGPSALIAALSVSGLSLEQGFRFVGFLPAKASGREKVLNTLSTERIPLIFYEAPHRIAECLQSIKTCFGGQREVLIARELTKKFEQTVMTTLDQSLQWITDNTIPCRGEFVVVVAGEKAPVVDVADTQTEAWLQELLAVMPLKQAVQIIATVTQLPKNQIYEQALILKKQT